MTNPTDVPTSDKERRRKTDKVDSNKLVRSLLNKELKLIYTPLQDILEDRSFVRLRSSIVKDQSRLKSCLKSILDYYGLSSRKSFKRSVLIGRNVLWYVLKQFN